MLKSSYLSLSLFLDYLKLLSDNRLNIESLHHSVFVNVHLCVVASKAVDCLLDSKWAKAKKGEEALFTTRESVVDYCNRCAPTLCCTLDIVQE